MLPTLYPNGLPSAYEELKTFYPVFYYDVFEMDAIWRVCGGRLDQIEADVDSVANCAFVSLMNEEALTRMEEFLEAPKDVTRSLEDRRKLVSSYFLGSRHIGAQEIIDITHAFTEGDVEVALEGGNVIIRIKADINDTPPADDYYYILRKKIPAHLGINTDIEIEFTNDLYVGAAAFQSDEYDVDPVKPEPQSAAGNVYAGTSVMQSDHITVDLRPQNGLDFAVEAFVGSTAYISTYQAVTPPCGRLTAAGGRISARTGAVESVQVMIDLLPGPLRHEVTAAAGSGGGIVENTHYQVYQVQEQGGI